MESELARQAIEIVKHILRSAHKLGRGTLFGHEVNAIPDTLGIDVPAHAKVKKTTPMTRDLSSLFPGTRIVVKAVTAGVSHVQAPGVCEWSQFTGYHIRR